LNASRNVENGLFVAAALIITGGSFSLPAVAQDKVWPESKIKIDPADVRHKVVNKLNEKSKGTFTVTETAPANFPVPLPTGIENPTFTTGPSMMAGTMKTKDVPASVIRWYRPILEEKGFKLVDHPKSASEASGRSSIITASRDDGTTITNLNISCVEPRPNYSILNIMAMQYSKGKTK
jgi:hypothetical protein